MGDMHPGALMGDMHPDALMGGHAPWYTDGGRYVLFPSVLCVLSHSE